MLVPWAVEEMKSVDLKDKRLNNRLARILSDLGDRPTASIPAACGGHKETIAAYRLFDHDEVTYEKVLEPHYARTLERMSNQPVVLLVQDTTEIDVTRPHQQVAGAGCLDTASRRGALMHLLEAFTTDGTPLGAVWSKQWTRDEPPEETRAEKERRRKQTPFEDKESVRWVEGLRHARQAAEQLPNTPCVCIADSEADIYELFAEPRGDSQIQWLVRACQDRALQDDRSEEQAVSAENPAENAGTEARRIREAVLATPVLFTKEISVRGRDSKISCDQRGRRQPRESRQTEVEIRATSVTLRPPYRPDRQLPVVTVNVVLVREVNPPAGDVAVEWLLVTTLPIDTVEQVREIIQYYSVRFLIEVFFRTLKSGCRVEERLFEHIDRLLPCVAVYLIVAWRTLLVCRLGRSCPDLDCEAVFDPSEWKSVWMVTKRQPPPPQPPRLMEMIKLVAQLGGYMNRPNREDPPGPQTVWLGLQRMRDLAWAWTTFGPGASKSDRSEPLLV